MNEQQRPDHELAMDRVIEQDRVLSTDAIMLPTDGKLDDERIAEVRQRVRNFITDSAGVQTITNKEVGAEIGFSPAVISEFLKAKYRGDNSRLARQLNIWLDRHSKRRRARGSREYIDTWACQQMAAYVRLADRMQQMAAIVAPSGAGKDMAIDVLAEELNGGPVGVVYCDTRTTATRLVQKIAEAVGVRVITDTSQLERRIVDKLKDRSMVLFINEAQTLAGRGKVGAACAGLLRSIYDQTGVPVVLFGSAEIFAFIDDRDPASGGGQLYRRCMKLNLMNLAAQEDDPDHPGQVGRPLFTREEVKRFLATQKIKLADSDALDLLYRVANLVEHGSLGLCAKVVQVIAITWPDQPATVDMIYTGLQVQLDTEVDVAQARIEAAQAADKPARAKAG